ncbi:Type IV pilin PilA [Euzebya pacifica]|uniref:Type IV pilin PilA n=1 Tax=Euzebya pacifica TaxID=1608957 RepID=A0A346XW62_9ACTN|nr:prepilin-type N-terminal cleavage/methylation domain-containing protein [Euzebya pacifica]AXV06459.1 Type IV pilin PilA [Euzebya pacifica]
MFDRLRKDEEGFTLIELLVVVIIIGILAAIAIPTFLNQREGAWRSTVESDMRNLATNLETYYSQYDEYGTVSAGGAVTDTTVAITGATAAAETYTKSDGTALVVVTPSTTAAAGAGATFCVVGTHENLAGETFYYDSNGGGLTTTACN